MGMIIDGKWQDQNQFTQKDEFVRAMSTYT